MTHLVGGYVVFACGAPFVHGFLGHDAAKFSFHAENPSRVHKLEVIVAPGAIHHAARGVFELRMPSLECLTVLCKWSDFQIRPENIPALRVLELTVLGASTASPLTNVTDLRYHIHSFDALKYNETSVLFNVPNLVQLALEAKHLGGVPNVEHRVVLPSLTSLEVRLMTQQRIGDIPRLFAAFSVPNLQSLALGFEVERYDFVTLLQSLVWT